MRFSLINLLSMKLWSTDREKRHRRDVRNARTMMRFNLWFTLPCLTLALVWFGRMAITSGDYLIAVLGLGIIPVMWWLVFKLDRFTKQREVALRAYGSHVVSKNALRQTMEEEKEDS